MVKKEKQNRNQEAPDLKRGGGTERQGKALHVEAQSVRSREYGAAKSTKLLGGTVLEAAEVQKPGNSRTS